MINNMSTSNVDVKAKEFTEILSELYYPWFAQYMVMKRYDRHWFSGIMHVPVFYASYNLTNF